jgi:hypothetical protein
MSDPDALDCLGRFLMQHVRDGAFESTERLLEGRWKSPSLQALQKALVGLSLEQRDLVRRSCRSIIDRTIHDFLFALVEETERARGRVVMTVDAKNAVALSDGLHGEPFGKRGWRARFSRFGEAPEED